MKYCLMIIQVPKHVICLRILSHQTPQKSKWSCATVCNLPMNRARSLSTASSNIEEIQWRLRKRDSDLSTSMCNFAVCFTAVTQEAWNPSKCHSYLLSSYASLFDIFCICGGLNMTYMSHPLLDLIASPALEGQLALKSTSCCERAQQCKAGGIQGAYRLHTLHMSALKRKPFMLNLSSVNTILHSFIKKSRQSICGKQYGLIYFFCSFGQVQDEVVQVKCGKPY